MTSPTAAVLGEVGLPASMRELASRSWDVVVIGAGHNGLACAAYLARAGKRVLVLEARARVGGACTIEEPFPGVYMSPCAYLAGLLHPLVARELNLAERGFQWTPAVNGLFVPFLDGSSIQLWDDDEACEAEVRRFSPADVHGWRAMNDVIRRLRDTLRPEGDQDAWIGDAPTAEAIDRRIGTDDEAKHLLYDWSMAEFVKRYLRDERLQSAYLGQGVIGTNASPFDAGTASIRFHHASGRLGGMPGMWGYVRGGMGMVSFYFCDAAKEAGAIVASGVAVAKIVPGEGVVLEGGERIHAAVVVSNADPQRTLRMVGQDADRGWREQIERIPIEGCTVKLNVLLRELPDFLARPGVDQPHHYGQINAPLTHEEWKTGYAASRRGELPEQLWCELYFQSVHDRTVAPAGQHTMSVFRAVCSVPFCARELGRAARRSAAGWRLSPCALLFKYRYRRDRRAGARPSRHRREGGTDGRAHLSGRVPAPVYVGRPAHAAHADEGPVPLRRVYASRRERDRDQWAKCRDGGAERYPQRLMELGSSEERIESTHALVRSTA